MKRLALICLMTILSFSAYTQVTIPRTPDQNTMALWHLDEMTPGDIQDVSGYGNHGLTLGTMVVPGRAGNGRFFNGTSDFISAGDPGNGSLDFSSAESFTVECWFKTTSSNPMQLIRKGLAPEPGYTLIVSGGNVVGMIGNRADGTPPDALLSITSTATFNDGQWHHAMLIRDRPIQKIFLYVDGEPAASPVIDTFPYSIASNRPLTIGRWENADFPYFFDGVMDEVRITRDARHPKAFPPLMALWNFDNPTDNTLLDSTQNYNHGLLSGTTITPGVSGSARAFNGAGDYILVNDAENGSLDFDSSQSFTVEAWFKSTSSAAMQLLRKGLAPDPGYALFVSGGNVAAVIGNREDGATPDTLLILVSAGQYIDGAWHRVTLVRDRATRTVSLYVDGMLVTPPMNDPFPYPIASNRPLTIGRWEYPSLPYYFQGSIDRVAITRGALHPPGSPGPAVLVNTEPINWGYVVLGDTVERRLTLYNAGTRDTLIVSALGTTLPVFSWQPSQLAIGPRDTASIVIRYAPTAVGQDSGSITFATNDPGAPSVMIPLLGRGTPVGMVTLVSPLNYATDNRDTVSFKWRKATPAATKYWFEWSTSYSFTERTVDSTLTDTLIVASGFPRNLSIYWRVRAGNQLGWGVYSLTRSFFRTMTSVPEAGSPSAYALLPNYPNPFNPSTTISFTLPGATQVRIDVHNAVGELVRVTADALYPPGVHRIIFDGAGLPSGMYFTRMRAGSVVLVQPMILMK
ncbi:MAG: hypothetical protein IPI01_16520 [Ignavibacteriae bacterium]|nr:hypothetical protein [Ignavibacteriota bacterium]